MLLSAPRVPMVGGVELSGFSAPLTTLVFTSEAKGQLFLQVSAPPTGPLGKGSVGQGVRWTAAGALNVENLGDARQRSYMWQHFNLQQSFLHMAAVTP